MRIVQGGVMKREEINYGHGVDAQRSMALRWVSLFTDHAW